VAAAGDVLSASDTRADQRVSCQVTPTTTVARGRLLRVGPRSHQRDERERKHPPSDRHERGRELARERHDLRPRRRWVHRPARGRPHLRPAPDPRGLRLRVLRTHRSQPARPRRLDLLDLWDRRLRRARSHATRRRERRRRRRPRRRDGERLARTSRRDLLVLPIFQRDRGGFTRYRIARAGGRSASSPGDDCSLSGREIHREGPPEEGVAHVRYLGIAVYGEAARLDERRPVPRSSDRVVADGRHRHRS